MTSHLQAPLSFTQNVLSPESESMFLIIKRIFVTLYMVCVHVCASVHMWKGQLIGGNSITIWVSGMEFSWSGLAASSTH